MLAQQTLEETQHAFYGMGTFLFFVVACAISAAAFAGVLAMSLVVAPNVTQRCSEALRSRNFVSFLAGLPFLGLFVLFAAIGQKAQAVGAIGVVALGVFAIVGLAAASEDIGRRLFWACGREGSRLSHLFAGWAVFFLSACLPIVGWFVILPYVALSGIGSILVQAFRGEAPPRACAGM